MFKGTQCFDASSFGRVLESHSLPPRAQSGHFLDPVSRKQPKNVKKKIALVLFKGTGGLGAKSFGNPPPSLPSLMAYIYKWPPPPAPLVAYIYAPSLMASINSLIDPPKPRKNALVLFKKTRCLGAISFGRPPPPLPPSGSTCFPAQCHRKTSKTRKQKNCVDFV